MGTLEVLRVVEAHLAVPPWLWAALAALAAIGVASLFRMWGHFAFVWKNPAHDDAAIRFVRGVRRLIFVACAVIFGFALVERSDTLWLTGAIILGEELYETGGGLLILKWDRAQRQVAAAAAATATAG